MSPTSLNCTSPLGEDIQGFIDLHHAVVFLFFSVNFAAGILLLFASFCVFCTWMLRERVVEQPIDVAVVQTPFSSERSAAKSVAAEAMAQRQRLKLLRRQNTALQDRLNTESQNFLEQLQTKVTQRTSRMTGECEVQATVKTTVMTELRAALHRRRMTGECEVPQKVKMPVSTVKTKAMAELQAALHRRRSQIEPEEEW